MKLTSRAPILAAAVAVAVLVPSAAFGVFTTGTSNPGNAVTAGVLKQPGTLTATAHVLNNATNAGDVKLTWNDGLSNAGGISPAGYLIERQTAGSFGWQPVATPAYGSACNASHACTFTDTTAAFNTAYSYRVRSTVGAWTAGPTNVRLAASIAPSTAEERTFPTDALNSVAYSGSGLIAVGQGGRILVCPGACTGSGSWQIAASPTGNDLHRVVFDTSASGRAWAVGAAGTVLTCASGCTSTSATWTSVNAGTTAALYGIAAGSGYVAVVGANLTMRFTVNAGYTNWQAGTVNAGTPTTTLYGIAVKNDRNVVIVGSRGTSSTGLIAACSAGGNSVCGGSTAFTAAGYASGNSAPAADLRDVAYVSGSGNSDHVYVVGTGGNVYVSTSLTSGYTKKTTGTSTDLYAVAALSQNAAGAVGEPASSSSVFLRCTSSCAATGGTWDAGPSTGIANRLSGITGSGGTYWAVGAAGTIRYFNGTTWTGQNASPAAVSAASLRANDGTRYALTTAATLGSVCAVPALVATATVPARSSAAVTSPAVKVTIGYDFTGTTNSSRVALSVNNGGTWSDAPLTANVSAATVATVDFSGAVAGSDSAQQILLCVQGAGGGGRMNVDMVHLDVDE